jgi:hypothetical protein
MRDDTCPELKRSRESLLRAWDALQKLRNIIEVFALEPVRQPSARSFSEEGEILCPGDPSSISNHQTDSSIMAKLLKIAKTKDVPPGQAAPFTIEGQKIALFNVEGTYYAVGNTCTHRGGPLSEATFKAPGSPPSFPANISRLSQFSASRLNALTLFIPGPTR